MRGASILLGLAAAVLPAIAQARGEVETAEHQAGSSYWYEHVPHNGLNPTMPNSKDYVVFRNVRDYGAKGDGLADDTDAIQKAINAGDGRNTRNAGSVFGSTGQPAVVYFPAGTYVVNTTVRSAVGTILMGDPTSRPTIKAAAGFTSTYLLFGRDSRYSGLVGFYHGIKNLVLDSTAMPGSSSITLLEWGVSQANQLANVMFNMPVGADVGHSAIAMAVTVSPLIMNDLQIFGGGVGITLSATQYHLKNIYFKNQNTAVKINSLVVGTGQGLRFEDCAVGIDTTSGGNGLFNLIDSTAANTSVVVKSGATSTPQGSLVLENVIVDSSVPATVQVAGQTALTGSVEPGSIWIRGNAYSAESSSPEFSEGGIMASSRPQILVNSTGFYHTVSQPRTLTGDGATDDTASLQAILDEAAGQKVVYFPHGIYLLGDTLTIPPGSRLVGEAWTQLSATGSGFTDAKNPKPMVKVGNAGDVGVAQMSDFLFTVADDLPGAVLVEVNMAGTKPGDVGFFNSHFRVGGARGSKLSGACLTPDTCKGARLSVHMKSTSSSYWENSWSWTADHNLDGNGYTYPGTAGGYLVEARNGTWMLGIGIEHNVLYQMNINNAENIFIGLQQSESAYWQGVEGSPFAPAPWTENLLNSDPDWHWCPSNDAQCRMGLYQLIRNSKNLNIYSSGFWNFVSGYSRTFCSDDCQENAVLYESNSKMYVYGIATMNSKNMVLESGVNGNETFAVGVRTDNSAAQHDSFQAAVIAAYLRQSA